MARIKPFRALLYNREIIGDLSRVTAPPYDVISEKLQDEYYNSHRNNVIRLILGKTGHSDNAFNNRYTRARAYLEEWLKKSILIQDDRPCLYIYEQKYLFRGRKKKRLGFISLMRIEDPHKSRVLPHEYTLARPKKDRMDLLKATGTNLSPIFSLFEDPGSSILSVLKRETFRRPIIDIEQDGVIHRVWRMSDPRPIGKIALLMKAKQVFIADGHHRYEVALNFRDWKRKRDKGVKGEMPCDYIMVYFSSLDPDALTILSTHRVIRSLRPINFKKVISRLEKYFYIENGIGKDEVLSRLEKTPCGEFVFGMYYKGRGFFVLTLKDKEALPELVPHDKDYKWKWLDVTVLHQLIFDLLLKVKEKVEKRDNIVYTKEVDHAISMVDGEDFALAFFLNPPRVEQVKDVARSHDRMPRKTTYFYPKPLSGLVFYGMEAQK